MSAPKSPGWLQDEPVLCERSEGAMTDSCKAAQMLEMEVGKKPATCPTCGGERGEAKFVGLNCGPDKRRWHKKDSPWEISREPHTCEIFGCIICPDPFHAQAQAQGAASETEKLATKLLDHSAKCFDILIGILCQRNSWALHVPAQPTDPDLMVGDWKTLSDQAATKLRELEATLRLQAMMLGNECVRAEAAGAERDALKRRVEALEGKLRPFAQRGCEVHAGRRLDQKTCLDFKATPPCDTCAAHQALAGGKP